MIDHRQVADMSAMADVLREFCVPEYFDSVSYSYLYSSQTYIITCYTSVDGVNYKAVEITKVGSTTTLKVYKADQTELLSLSGGYYTDIYQCDGGVMCGSGTTSGASMYITHDINGDTVFAACLSSSSISPAGTIVAAVRPLKSTMHAAYNRPVVSANTLAMLTTMSPLVLTDGSGSYCDKAFLIVTAQYLGSGSLCIGADTLLYGTTLAILDS